MERNGAGWDGGKQSNDSSARSLACLDFSKPWSFFDATRMQAFLLKQRDVIKSSELQFLGNGTYT